MTPARADRRRVWKAEERLGEVHLTQRQVDLIVMATLGCQPMGNYGSTKWEIEMKILTATGWERMKFVQLCCRFAYKHGLVRL
jgi:hypothetical protein